MSGVLKDRCRVWKLALQVERGEIPMYRGYLATVRRVTTSTSRNELGYFS